jgi:transcription initiation factor TFIIIB Brf1 subunit/transcription initiation factor TFIIB
MAVDVTDIKSLDSIIRNIIPQPSVLQYENLTRDLLDRYSHAPRKICFMAPKNNIETNAIIREFLSRALMFLVSVDDPLKDTILEKYENLVEESNSKDTSGGEGLPPCKECGSSNTVYDQNYSSVVCLECGVERDSVDEGFIFEEQEDESPEKSNSRAFRSVTKRPLYERMKHFKELVDQFQGKVSKHLDQTVACQLLKAFEQNGLNPATVTRANIYRFLSEGNRRDCYDLVNYYYHLFTGKPLPDLSNIEQRLFEDYVKLQRVYNSLSREERQDRNNFLKGSQVLERLLKKYNVQYDKDSFISLKTEDRIQRYNVLLDRIFKKLEWE